MTLSGDVGITHVPDLDRQLSALSARRPQRVILDLSKIEFISSLGMGTLAQFQRGMARHKGVTYLAAPTPTVHEAVKRCRLEQVLKIFADVNSALAA